MTARAPSGGHCPTEAPDPPAVPPKKGTKHTLRIVRELLALEPGGTGTDLKGAADHLLHVLPRRSIVFVVSDFLVDGVEETMRVLGARHDATAIHVNDPREIELAKLDRTVEA